MKKNKTYEIFFIMHLFLIGLSFKKGDIALLLINLVLALMNFVMIDKKKWRVKHEE